MSMYKQLTQYHRYHIRIYWKAGYSLSVIAQRLIVHKSTVSLEIRRNRGHKGYRPRAGTWNYFACGFWSVGYCGCWPKKVSLSCNYFYKR